MARIHPQNVIAEVELTWADAMDLIRRRSELRRQGIETTATDLGRAIIMAHCPDGADARRIFESALDNAVGVSFLAMMRWHLARGRRPKGRMVGRACRDGSVFWQFERPDGRRTLPLAF